MIPTLLDDTEKFKTFVEEVTTDMLEIARELELEVEPEDVTKWLWSRSETLMDKESLLWMSEESVLMRRNLLPMKMIV